MDKRWEYFNGVWTSQLRNNVSDAADRDMYQAKTDVLLQFLEKHPTMEVLFWRAGFETHKTLADALRALAPLPYDYDAVAYDLYAAARAVADWLEEDPTWHQLLGSATQWNARLTGYLWDHAQHTERYRQRMLEQLADAQRALETLQRQRTKNAGELEALSAKIERLEADVRRVKPKGWDTIDWSG